MQAGVNSTGSHTISDPGGKPTDTKPDNKGKATIGEATPPSDQANTKGQKVPNDTSHGDDRSNKSAGPEQNPIDTSITILGPPPNSAKAREWRLFKAAHGSEKASGVAKSSTQGNKTRTKSTRIIRNAIGQPVIQVIDARGHLIKKGDPPTINGIPTSTGPAATGVASAPPHPKPLAPLAWSLARPHDPPAGATPFQAGLKGYGMIRIGAGAAAIGGAANLNTGVLSGSSFHPKLR
jgi:hypothetical protein